RRFGDLMALDVADMEEGVLEAIEAIRPALQSDGGDIVFNGIDEDGVVHVSLVGACGTCPVSMMTLKAGVERIIMDRVPGISEVVVPAVDPSSPFSGGAILGDRVRMQSHTSDPGVFIRSMATHGHLGGLSLATPQAVRVLDAVGKAWIVIETVGVGQVEVEIAG